MGKWHWSFEAIGTHWEIDITDPPPHLVEAELLLQVTGRIDQFDQTYSRFRPDSLITKMAGQAGVYQLPPDAQALFDLYKRLYDLTAGAFTPLIGQTMEQAGYDAQYSLKPKPLEALPGWDEVMTYHYPTLEIKQPIMLDFGAGGKGYLVDIIGNLLKESGITSFCVDAGSDLVQQNSNNQTLEIGLEHPDNLEQVIGIATIINQSLCASAGNRRKWKGYHHIINPHTMQSPEDILAVWAVARTTLLADALATALFLVPPESLSQFQFEYLILNKDYSVSQSNGFPAKLFFA